MVLALIAVLRRSIAHGSINGEFIKGLMQYNFSENDILLEFQLSYIQISATSNAENYSWIFEY